MRDLGAFNAYLEARAGWAFGYGPEPRTHDCARWASGAARAATGRDPLKAFASCWTTELGAARVLRRHGGMAAAVGTVLTEIDPTFAQRADIGLASDRTLVLFLGDGLIGLNEAGGYLHLPRANAVRAWSVG